MEIDISGASHTWQHPHLWGARVVRSNVFAGKSYRRSASHHFTCFSQGQYSKDTLLWDGFFLEETSCWAVRLFLVIVLKKLKEPISSHQAQVQGCYATGASPWWFSHSFLPDIGWTGPWQKPNHRATLSPAKKEQWLWNLSDQSPGFTCSHLCHSGKIPVSPWTSVLPCGGNAVSI